MTELPASAVCQGGTVGTVTNNSVYAVDVSFRSATTQIALGSVGPGSSNSFLLPDDPGGRLHTTLQNAFEPVGPTNGTGNPRDIRVVQECRGEWLALSPRETARGTVGGASVAVEYGRPGQNNRIIWGGLVPWDTVWQIGAGYPSMLTTTSALRIGGTRLPAGTYSLWMIPSDSGPSMLLMNRRTRRGDLGYRTGGEVARVPLERTWLDEPEERLTIAVEANRLRIGWGHLAWSVAVTQP